MNSLRQSPDHLATTGSAATNGHNVPAPQVPKSQRASPPSIAAHGGGPRTVEGKRAVSVNAVSHGIASMQPVIKGESPEEWDAHHQALQDQFQPVGGYEDLLVYRIALVFWQMARLDRFLLGATQNRMEALDDPEPPPVASPWAVQAPDRSSERHDPEPLLRWLDELDQLDDDAPLGAAAVDVVLCFVDVSDEFRWPGVPVGREPSDVAGWTAGRMRACIDAAAKDQGLEPPEVLGAAREEIISLCEASEQVRAQAEREREAQLERRRRYRERAERTAILPAADVLDRTMRYSTQHQRSLERFMKMLETSQRARHGTLPPPIRVDISGS
jgi:hypothetical protein